MIKLSASMIKDYISCSQRAYYRFNFPEESTEINEVAVGNIVHKVLESEWNNYDRAVDLSIKLLHQYNLISNSTLYAEEKILKCLGNFFNLMPEILDGSDFIEYRFDIKYKNRNDIRLVGKIDRVTKDGIIFDWKTSYQTPESIDNDIQFIYYYIAYTNIFNTTPTNLFLVSLINNEMIRFNPKEYFIDTVWNELIPMIADSIKKKHFYREGMYNNNCEQCPFQSICWRQLWEQNT